MQSEKTFANDEFLPDLPLPKMEDTLTNYLESVKPFMTEQEFVNTKGIVADFEKNEGVALHDVLVKRTQTHRNWVTTSFCFVMCF